MKVSFSAMLLLTVSAWAQPQSTNARDLLQRVAETYRNLESFEWTAVFTVSTDSGDFQPSRSRVVGEFRRPRQMRIGWPESQPMDWVEITDGKTIWLYYPSRRGYCRPDPKLMLQRTPHEAMAALGWSLPFEHIKDGLKSTRFIGNRSVRIGHGDVNCRLVIASYDPENRGGLERYTPLLSRTALIRRQTS